MGPSKTSLKHKAYKSCAGQYSQASINTKLYTFDTSSAREFPTGRSRQSVVETAAFERYRPRMKVLRSKKAVWVIGVSLVGSTPGPPVLALTQRKAATVFLCTCTCVNTCMGYLVLKDVSVLSRGTNENGGFTRKILRLTPCRAWQFDCCL